MVQILINDLERTLPPKTGETFTLRRRPRAREAQSTEDERNGDQGVEITTTTDVQVIMAGIGETIEIGIADTIVTEKGTVIANRRGGRMQRGKMVAQTTAVALPHRSLVLQAS